MRASVILAWLIKQCSSDEIERIKGEARELFGDDEGRLKVESLDMRTELPGGSEPSVG
jgi:hypothetical protein